MWFFKGRDLKSVYYLLRILFGVQELQVNNLNIYVKCQPFKISSAYLLRSWL